MQKNESWLTSLVKQPGTGTLIKGNKTQQPNKETTERSQESQQFTKIANRLGQAMKIITPGV